MKKLFSAILGISIILTMSACSDDGQYEDPIGDDWHVWGMYDFVSIGEVEAAIGKAYNDDKQFIGYNIYADGASQGPLLGKLYCTDAGCLPEDIDEAEGYIINDYTGDGADDIGIKTRSGDILWFAFAEDENGEPWFEYRVTQPAVEAGK